MKMKMRNGSTKRSEREEKEAQTSLVVYAVMNKLLFFLILRKIDKNFQHIYSVFP